MSPSPLDYLNHIQDEINYLLKTSGEISKEDFFSDLTYQRAFSRSLEIIGEASKKLDPDFKNLHQNVSWSNIFLVFRRFNNRTK